MSVEGKVVNDMCEGEEAGGEVLMKRIEMEMTFRVIFIECGDLHYLHLQLKWHENLTEDKTLQLTLGKLSSCMLCIYTSWR